MLFECYPTKTLVVVTSAVYLEGTRLDSFLGLKILMTAVNSSSISHRVISNYLPILMQKRGVLLSPITIH